MLHASFNANIDMHVATGSIVLEVGAGGAGLMAVAATWAARHGRAFIGRVGIALPNLF